MPKTLVIDNFDSFTYNLVQYLGELGGNPMVFRNDEITVQKAQELRPTHIVISPGPGRPDDEKHFGVCREIILEFDPKVPLLGVCLGHQGIVSAFAGGVGAAPQIVHGKTSQIFYEGEKLFAGLPNPFIAMRYHSLSVDRDSLPAVLEITAWTADGLVMAIRHRQFPLWGIQFHPESIGTPEGKKILANFLNFK